MSKFLFFCILLYSYLATLIFNACSYCKSSCISIIVCHISTYVYAATWHRVDIAKTIITKLLYAILNVSFHHGPDTLIHNLLLLTLPTVNLQ